jgi:uncharacterized membrane protein YfcA
MDWGTDAAGALIAFAVATLTTPAGVSGAVLLIPVQVSILGVANPALTPTNLLYNVIATPGALAGYRSADWKLVRRLAAGTLPGVIAGAILRVTVLEGADVFYVVIAAVLGPLGVWLLLDRSRQTRRPRPGVMVAIAAAVGLIGGIYGIGGGSLLAPILVGMGLSVVAVAPATIAVTFVTSVVGVVTFALLSIGHSGSIAPDWDLGVAMGLGGLIGGFCGARLQGRLPESLIRRTLGGLALLLAIRYAAIGLGA